MINYFIGKSKAWLEEELGKAQEDLAAGSALISVQTGDNTTAAQIQVNIRTRIEQLLYSLHLIDPTKYPASSVKRVTRTRCQVYGSVS